MADVHAPFRFDYVGSFLRPDVLKQARADAEAGLLSAEQLRVVEDVCIRDLVKKQQSAGYAVITDGEFRRSYWHLDFMWGLNGIEHLELDHGYFFHGEETTHGSAEVSGKISGEHHPFVEDFKFVQALCDEHTVAKQCIPAPAQTLAELFREDNGITTRKFYPSDDELIHDLAAAYHTVILDLYEAGCRNIQLDDCTWGMLVDDGYWAHKMNEGVSFEEEAERFLTVNNLALENLPQDLTVTTHVCRGNYHSTYACTGPYDRVAPYLFARERVDAFYLEFDDERSGGFECLAELPTDKKVVLGLVTSKRPELESAELIKARVAEAAAFVDRERLYLSPQCGFASCEIGNKLSEAEQWAKLAHVRALAEEIWA
ncbi:5-methyltetrahydropteroyltriglutamate--homocysteine S-methyltransferase [Collinsella sp. zg1085]|uniref:5-methyltetrahydropteroyltriglutamate-- homocysteine S-methyltransferase n=1 Tax=Collinsella sp. zg1085 TaxID=2844380 RepID=UPI001C0D8DE0|nr:5-methyltetrahydropteroyltriglutamate--homocysteine S-methyltransferase [Collinsella sp. zg1085]QWT17948.1 5-methyltetrahydropteroyltriglutamate--homocysteine S-methyltransferase [Collinsella sp. zg1085]